MTPIQKQQRRAAEDQLARHLIARSVFNEIVPSTTLIETAGFSVPVFMAAEDVISQHMTAEITRLVSVLGGSNVA